MHNLPALPFGTERVSLFLPTNLIVLSECIYFIPIVRSLRHYGGCGIFKYFSLALQPKPLIGFQTPKTRCLAVLSLDVLVLDLINWYSCPASFTKIRCHLSYGIAVGYY